MQTAPIKVLLVEDDPTDAEFARRTLPKASHARFELCCAPCLSGALECLREGAFDVMLLDLGLPDCDELHALDEVRQANHLIPIVILTGLNDESTSLASMERGAQDYLVKGSFTADTLSRSIRYAIQRQQLLAATHDAKLAAESRGKLAAIVECSDDAIISQALDGTVTSWNKAAERMYGYTAEEVLGRTTAFLFPSDGEGEMRRLLLAIQNGEELRHFETERMHKNGQRVSVSLSVSPIRGGEGKIVGVSKIARDITERKQMEAELAQRDEQLRQSQKLEAVGLLAGGIAHEFNNLLQAIRGYTQFAMQDLRPDEQRFQDLNQVLQAANRAAALTRQLLGFSRQEVLRRVHVDPRQVVTDLVKLVRPLIGEQIELTTPVLSDVGTLFADPGLLQQMLLNLCINARDAMPSGGRLALSLERVELNERYCELHSAVKPGAHAVFSLADTGCGMTPEIRERIFEPFFSTKEVGRGTGLGLPMVYGIVQQHAGAIIVDSEPGAGTTFKIYLPLVAGPASTVDASASATSRAEKETILLAEDEPMVRDLAVRILSGAGYSVLSAADGAQAVELFESHADIISLALLDAMMPKLNGHQVCRRIRLAKPDVPVVFCSGYDAETGQVQFLLDEGVRLVQKPFDPDELLRTLREVLDGAAVKHEGPTHQVALSPCPA